jgi:rhodanese-related sulfurtransferase
MDENDLELQPDRVAELTASGEVQLVDVRTHAEYAAGHLEGSENIPFDELAARAEELDRSRPVVLVCRSGGRSAVATQAFAASGWQAHSMAGGVVGWTERGLPLEPADGKVLSPSGVPGAPPHA